MAEPEYGNAPHVGHGTGIHHQGAPEETGKETSMILYFLVGLILGALAGAGVTLNNLKKAQALRSEVANYAAVVEALAKKLGI